MQVSHKSSYCSFSNLIILTVFPQWVFILVLAEKKEGKMMSGDERHKLKEVVDNIFKHRGIEL